MQQPDEQWSVYLSVIREARARGIEHAIGGGLAVATYTTHRQQTKDIDLYILPENREAMIDVVTRCGLADLYDRDPYDRKWIYRSYRDDTIVDIMWSMPNQRAQVDQVWLSRARDKDFFGERIRVLPPEELIWAKLYVLQRDRCDWPDILNIIYATSDQMDWDHLLNRVGEDVPLLDALLTIFRWLCPERAIQLPSRGWEKVHAHNGNGAGRPAARASLLDTRPWFLPAIEEAQQQEAERC